MREKVYRLHELLSTFNIATEEEISLVTSIIGYSLESLEKILYSRTGCREWNQFEEEVELWKNITTQQLHGTA